MKKILFVVTSHDEMGDSGKKTGLWLSEVAEPYFIFMNKGIEVTVASPKGGEVPIDPASLEGAHENPILKLFLEDKMDILKHTVSLDKIDFHQYDAVLYPGGHGLLWDLSQDKTNAKLISDFFNHGKIVASLCTGSAALLSGINDKTGESIVKNRAVTGLSDSEQKALGLDNLVPFLLESKFESLGVKYSKSEQNFHPHVVTDGCLFTGQNPASAIPLAEKIVEELYSK